MALMVTDAMRSALKRGSGSGLPDDEIDRLLGTAAILVRRWIDSEDEGDHLPPEAIETEATLRTAGFMADSPAGPIARQQVNDTSTDYASGHRLMSPVRGSGAMSLLSPWKKRGPVRWPWSRPERETRSSGGYTAAITEALLGLAEGDTLGGVQATAALEAASGMWARAFASAKVEPEDARTAGLSADVLALIGRELCRRGESVHLIDVEDGRVRLLPAGSWDVHGGSADPESWTYRIYLSGPSGTETRVLPSAAVLHPRYAVEPVRPWAGVGPLQFAAATGKLAGSLEAKLAQEAGGVVGHVIPVPGDGEDGSLDNLREGIAKAKGGTSLVETTASGYGEGKAAAPMEDWKPRRIGADPPPVLDALKTSTGRAVAAACGIAPALVSRADGTALREGYRQFLFGTVAPVAKILEQEMSEKLDADVRLVFDELRASDLAGRARAFKAMVTAGMKPARAAALSGLLVE